MNLIKWPKYSVRYNQVTLEGHLLLDFYNNVFCVSLMEMLEKQMTFICIFSVFSVCSHNPAYWIFVETQGHKAALSTM